MNENKQINKNGFLITCISCIALLLVMLYFGINSPFKGTRAATDEICTCPDGSEVSKGSSCRYVSATDDGNNCVLNSETEMFTCSTAPSCVSTCNKVGQTCIKGDKTGKLDSNCVCVVSEDSSSSSSTTNCSPGTSCTTTDGTSGTCQSPSNGIYVCVPNPSPSGPSSSPTSCASIGDATTCVNSSLNCQWDYNNGCTNKSSNTPTSCASIGDATTCVNSSLNCQWDYSKGCTNKSSSPSDKQCTLKYEASCGASFTYTGASTVPSFNDCVISTTHAKYTYTCTNNGKDSDGCIKGSCTVKFAGCDVNYALNSSGECCYCPGCADSPNAPNPTVPTGGGGPVNPSNPGTGGNPNPSNPNPGNPSNPNVSDNPQTSDILIFIVWFVGLCAICYSLWYYKNAKNN